MFWNYIQPSLHSSPYTCIDALKYVDAYRKAHYCNKKIASILHVLYRELDITDSSEVIEKTVISTLRRLGFIYPEIQKTMGFEQSDLGQLDVITPAGWNLIQAETVASMQECYLRAMATPIHQCGDNLYFSPLCWTLAILLELEKRGMEPAVDFIEMATVVQTSDPSDGLASTVDRLCDLRMQRVLADRKRSFDRDVYIECANRFGRKEDTFKDYADMNMRYLKASGMVQSKGKGIALIPEKRALAIELAKELTSDKPLLELYRTLCNGSPLPTDNKIIANNVLRDLLDQIQNYGLKYSIAGKPLDTPVHINKVRHEIEELIAKQKEEIYAARQAEQWEEIAAYMDLLASRREKLSFKNETEIRVPKTEAPAYLEWSLWRAFLAINTLTNKPYEVRRFKIDQDFLPVSTAPGNGPDLIAEFEDYVIVIEVTLSESSRQEAMEGEPVRRHVADQMLQYNKPVYGLFIANRIDSNTAETFRIGVWYTNDDTRMELHIIPFTLAQFCSFFKSLFTRGGASPNAIVSLMVKCESFRREYEAPLWKQKIANTIEKSCR